MMPLDGPDAVDLIDKVTEMMKAGETIGVDGMTFSVAEAQRMEQEFTENGIRFRTDFPSSTSYGPTGPLVRSTSSSSTTNGSPEKAPRRKSNACLKP